jgi:hypothetical protein
MAATLPNLDYYERCVNQDYLMTVSESFDTDTASSKSIVTECDRRETYRSNEDTVESY